MNNIEEKQEIVEQPEVESGVDNESPPEETKGSTLGKFADASELLKAYESLEAEFTRKSQLLAELQQGTASVAIEKKPDVVPSRDEIIQDYLKSIATRAQAPAVITTNNDFAFGTVPTHKSIRESAKIAENFFRNKEIHK